MKIWLTDNSEKTFPCGDVQSLLSIADKPIKQLCKENEHLLIYPYCIEDTEDKIGELPIMSSKSADSGMIRILTGNVLGFIGKGNLQLTIKSRFDDGRDDYFMHYMLQKVLSFNLFDLNHNSEQDSFMDFLILMFPYFLKTALKQGIYREYKTHNRNDANVKGTIDISRHIRTNIPCPDGIAYSYRDYNCDNSITELIRHTIEFMRTHDYGRVALAMNQETISNIKTIENCTPSYDRNARTGIIGKNLRHKGHPFYTAYQPLQSLCLQILRMDEIRYGKDSEEICGILFDGAWLWEEYINSLLEPIGFTHPRNKKGTGRITLFEDGSGVRYPDFYKTGIVLDAKYKEIGSYDNVASVGREDLHQIIAYITALNSTLGGFIAPLRNKQEIIPSKKLRGLDATIAIFGIEIIRSSSSYSDFCEKMKYAENDFFKSISAYNT